MRTGLALLEQRISLRQGAGGSAMRALIEDVFLRDASEVEPGEIGPLAMDDGAALRVGDRWLILTTDSHVVHPIFFPGGDIGRLSISGTVNDLAMMGATEVLGLTCGAIIAADEHVTVDVVRKLAEFMRRDVLKSCHDFHTVAQELLGLLRG